MRVCWRREAMYGKVQILRNVYQEPAQEEEAK